MIYFDNAATGGFKPHAVIDATNTVIRYLSANPGRSGHRLSLTGAEIIYKCRETLSNFFGCKSERVIFTKNCTEALNIAIFGSVKKGDHVICTVFEHNSVLRPLHHLKNTGIIDLSIIKPDDDTPLQRAIERAIKPNTRLIVCTALSNVTGEVMPITEIAQIAKYNGALLLVDGAQAGGHIPLNVKDGISMLALAGHKALCGIMGSGVLILDDNVDVCPLVFGGTGSESFNLNQPSCYPEKLESGTLNLPAIASLYEGVKFVSKNLVNFGNQLIRSTKIILDGLEEMNIPCFSRPNPAGICSFKINGIPSNEVADVLNKEYDVAVRGGLHCAPLTHEFLNTESEGLVRASLAVQNTSNEIKYFLSAVNKIAKGHG